MTVTDIVKALKCCGKNVLYENCVDCPYEKDFGKDHICTIEMAKDALDLINRQQAKIETLKKSVEIHKGIAEDWKYEAKKLKEMVGEQE